MDVEVEDEGMSPLWEIEQEKECDGEGNHQGRRDVKEQVCWVIALMVVAFHRDFGVTVIIILDCLEDRLAEATFRNPFSELYHHLP